MKLYYKPGACSLASHIVLRELDADFSLEKVDTKEKKTESGENYLTINPNGYVPALKLDEERVLTEGPAILQYLADTHQNTSLLPVTDSFRRARVQQYLNFVGSELHKAFAPFFSGAAEGDARASVEAAVNKRLDYVETLFADGHDYLTGDTFTIADAYLFVVASWSRHVGINLDKWPNLTAFVGRVAKRPAVQTAMQAEGLI